MRDPIADLEMTKDLYETIVKLTELAVTGKEKMEAEADGPEDRKAVAEAEATIIMGQFYVNEYEERHRHGQLK